MTTELVDGRKAWNLAVAYAEAVHKSASATFNVRVMATKTDAIKAKEARARDALAEHCLGEARVPFTPIAEAAAERIDAGAPLVAIGPPGYEHDGNGTPVGRARG